MNKELEHLSKNLAIGMPRRKALWRFASGLAGLTGLGFLTTKKASAQEGVFGCFELSSDSYDTCSGIAGNSQSFCTEVALCSFESCLAGGGACSPCPGDLELCGEVCLNTMTDPDNCGECGYVCKEGQKCVDGACKSSG